MTSSAEPAQPATKPKHSLVGRLHERVVHSRRVDVLTEQLVPLLPSEGTILDVGCGDGLISSLIARRLPGTELRGVDVVPRSSAHIPVEYFDGVKLPMADDSVDVAMLVDVVHHALDPEAFLREVARVARRAIVIKDHLCEGFVDDATLRFMDWIGNARYGVALPYNYQSKSAWHALCGRLGLRIERWETLRNLYGFPGDLVFGRGLHFVARLSTTDRVRG
jgi:SAM-dependent methyltransferase